MVNDAQTPVPVSASDPGPASAHRVIRNGASNLLVQAVYATLTVAVVVVLARGGDKTVLGGYYTLFALVTVVQLLLEAGLCTLLTRRIAQATDDWKRLAAEATGLFGVIALMSAGVFLVGGAVWSWATGDVRILVECAAAGVACAAVQLQRLCIGVFRAFDVFHLENTARVLQPAVLALLVAALAWQGSVTVTAVIAALAVSQTLAAAFLLVSLQRRFRCLSWRPGPVPVRDWLRQSVPLGLGDVVRGLAFELDTLVLGLIRPAAAVGIYTVAYRPLGPLGWVSRGVLTAAFPSIARLAARDPDALGRAASRSTRLLWAISLLPAVAVCVCAEPLVLLVAGPAYLDAVLPMRILACLVPLGFLGNHLRFFLTAAGRQRTYGRLVLLSLVLKAAALAALVPGWGYLGACAASAAGELVFVGIGLVVCHRAGIGRVEWGAAVRAALAAGVTAGLLVAVLGTAPLLLAPGVVVAALVYLVLCVLLGVVRWDEVCELVAAVRARVRPAHTTNPGDGSSASGPPVDLIRAAAAQMSVLRAGGVAPPVPLTDAALSAALGEEVRGHTLWRVTWNRIYLVETARGRTLVAKQVCTQTEPDFLQECAHLDALARLGIARLRVPRPLARLTPERTYVVERMPGRTLSALLLDGGRDAAELCRACDLAGRVLGRVHAGWARADSPFPADALWRDLALVPGGYTGRQWAAVERAVDRLAAAPVAVGQPYLDFNPRNILVHPDGLALIDPPKECRRDLLLWDYATFRIELRREVWKDAVRRPWGRRGALLRAGIAAFDRGYSDAAPSAVSPLLVRLLELQRVGQLLTQRLTEVGLATLPDSPIPRDGCRLRCLGVAAASVGLLTAQKRWLLRRLADDLARPSALPARRGVVAVPVGAGWQGEVP